MQDPAELRRTCRIVFMGTPGFAAAVLRGVLEDGWTVAGVVTQPDRPRGRGRKVLPSPVKQVALERGLPLLQPASARDPAYLEALRARRPDLALVAAYGRILPREVLAVPRHGCYNVHASLLPAYRGAAPIQRAILQGETETGITLFRMDAGMDTGDVLTARRVPIGPEQTAGDLTATLAGLAVEMLPGALAEICGGSPRLEPQDPERATYAPPLRKEEGRIRWDRSARSIADQVRGLDPWPGACTFWRGKRLRIAEAAVETPRLSGDRAEPGEVLASPAGELHVRTGDGVLGVRAVQLEGKRRMEVSEFMRGHALEPGERLG